MNILLAESKEEYRVVSYGKLKRRSSSCMLVTLNFSVIKGIPVITIVPLHNIMSHKTTFQITEHSIKIQELNPGFYTCVR